MSRTFVFLIPVGLGLLWLLTTQRENRRQFIQNRLNALTATGKSDTDETPKLERKLPQTAWYASLLPYEIRERLHTAFARTGDAIGLLHLIVGALVSATIALLFTGRVLGLVFPWVMLVTGVAAAVAPLLVLWFAKSRYQQRFLDVFPDALDLVRRAVKAGLPVNEALHAAGREIADPVGEQLRQAFELVQVGIPMIVALETVASRIRIPDFQFMVVALALQEKTGGSLAETLGNLSAVIRARKALRLKARSLTAESKMSAIVLAALPFVIGGAMYVLNRDLTRMLIADDRGFFMLGVAFLSLVTGLVTMFVIVKRALR